MSTIDDIIATASERYGMDTSSAEESARLYFHQIKGIDGQDYDEDDLPAEAAEFIIESIRRAQQDVTITPLDRVAEAADRVAQAEDALRQARDERNSAILAAIDAGANKKATAEAAGVNRQTVYNILEGRPSEIGS